MLHPLLKQCSDTFISFYRTMPILSDIFISFQFLHYIHYNIFYHVNSSSINTNIDYKDVHKVIWSGKMN